MEPECICANRAKVESMVHPYCPKHSGGDPGPGIGACESCDGPEQPAVVVVGVGTRGATRLCLDCLLAHALNVTTQRDSALAELAAAREAIPLRAIETCAYLARKSGELGSSAAYLEVHDWLDAYRALQQQTSPQAVTDGVARPAGTFASGSESGGVPPSRGDIGGPSGLGDEWDAPGFDAAITAAFAAAPDLPEPCAVCSEALCECDPEPRGVCWDCDGSGMRDPRHSDAFCPACNGTGRADGGEVSRG